jgi:sterol desaturase/sphingolipid hydroxylase (fatty acid hydroxylase superfamily)
MLSGLLGAYISYRNDREVSDKRTFAGFVHYCLPKELWRNKHVRIDACFTVLSRFTSALFVTPIVLTILAVVPLIHAGLVHLLGARQPHESTLALQVGLVIVCIIARDFMEFATHALSHRWQFLWEFHRVHHSSEFLSPLGEKRSHFIDDLWRNGCIAAVVGVSLAVYTYAAGIPPYQTLLFGVPAYIVAYTIMNLLNFEVLHHSHIPLSYGRFERALISPAQHQLHHDRHGPSRNYGSFLSIWDRLFGSFAHSVPRGSFELGLPYEEQRECMTLPELYVRPFFRAARLVWNALGPRSQSAGPIRAAANCNVAPSGDKMPADVQGLAADHKMTVAA